MSLKLIHCADFHIGASLSQLNTALAKKRSEEIRNSLVTVADLCKEKEVDALLIAGDLFDTPNPSKADCEFVKNVLTSLSPVNVYIICGNHDYMCADSPFSSPENFPDNVHIFPCYEYAYEIPEKNAVIWGKSYSSTIIEPSFEKAQFDDAKLNIMLLHGDTVPGSSFNIISRETLSSLPCNYAAFGHIHAGEIFDTGKVKCAYSGASEGHSFGDCGTTGLIYAEISEDGTILTPMDTSLRKYRHVDIDITGKTEEDILSYARSLINDTDFFRITLKGEFPEKSAPDTIFIKENLKDSVFYVDIVDETYPCYDFDSIEKEDSLRGAFLRELRKKTDSEEDFIIAAKTGLDALSGRLTDLGGAL